MIGKSKPAARFARDVPVGVKDPEEFPGKRFRRQTNAARTRVLKTIDKNQLCSCGPVANSET